MDQRLRARAGAALRIGLGIGTLFLLLGAPWPAALGSEDIEFTDPPTGSQLRSLTRELGVSLCPVALTPAEPLGTLRTDVSASATGTKIDGGAEFWRIASDGEKQSGYFVLARARFRLGLPFGIDAGASYGRAPGTNVGAVGGEISWAFIRGGSLVPALAVRLAHSRMRGVDQMDLKATALDLSISKGFAFLTPYAGIGQIWLSSEVHDIQAAKGFSLDSSPQLGRVFVGARFSAAWLRTIVEAQRADGIDSYSVKLGITIPSLPRL